MSRDRDPAFVARQRRLARRLWLGAFAGLFGGCVDELPVDVRIGSVLDVTIDQGTSAMVGMTDTVRLQVLLDGVQLTGLRVRWQAFDSTALAVRSLADAGALPPTPTAEDSLDATLSGEVTFLKRGIHSFFVIFDSVGIEGVDIDTVEVRVQERWQAVSAGVNHTCAVTFANTFQDALNVPLRRGGEVFCWGQGQYGALGTGFSERTEVPARVESSVTFDEVRAGKRYTCARDDIGLMYCWGDNFEGQLGLGNLLDQFVPRLISLGESFASFDVGKGSLFTCAARSQELDLGPAITPGRTLCWGQNDLGQLGCGSSCDTVRLTQPNTKDELFVTRAGGQAPRFRSLSLGLSHACGVDEVGTGYCWGDNQGGALGVPVDDDATFSRDAVEVQGGLKFSAVAAGGTFSFFAPGGALDFTCGIEQDSLGVHCWGQMGSLGTMTDTPIEVSGLPAGPFSALTAGASHACVLDANGAAYCWGENTSGQLGNGRTGDSHMTAVKVEGGLTFGVLSAGAEHTCAITVQPLELEPRPGVFRDSGGIYCWGSDLNGELGNGGELGDSSVPGRVVEPGFKAATLFVPSASRAGVSQNPG